MAILAFTMAAWEILKQHPQYIFAVCIPFEWSPNRVNANKFKTFTHRKSLDIMDSTTFNWSLGLVHRGYILAILHKLHIPDMEIFHASSYSLSFGIMKEETVWHFSEIIFFTKNTCFADLAKGKRPTVANKGQRKKNPGERGNLKQQQQLTTT